MALTMWNSYIASVELRFRNTNSVRECVLLAVVDDGRHHTGYFIVYSLDMHLELAECCGYDLKCSVSQSKLVGNGVILHVWDPGIHRQPMKLNHSNSGILFHTQTEDVLTNAKQLKRPVCALAMHQRESFLVIGGIENWVVRLSSNKRELFESAAGTSTLINAKLRNMGHDLIENV
ncbi:hypothetical protein RND71_037787 [Anisodus tanguticus]|uniref:Uncharacterized protein n=1 Tax=Anisodus tanguticus TaxID=243964 RepID=A0AAE1QZ80_9SOLA|nr:hypothetical protein RND71_037787 [Anisodus tanguticus]